MSFSQSLYWGDQFPELSTWGANEIRSSTIKFSIAEDKRGLLYVGNEDGLLEFDGFDWKQILQGENLEVYSIALDSSSDLRATEASSRLYIGAKGDFGYLDTNPSGQWEFHSLKKEFQLDSLEFGQVWNTIITTERIIFRSQEYLFIYDGEKVISIRPNGKGEIQGFHGTYKAGDIVFVREWETGLHQLSGDSLVLLPGGERFTKEVIWGIHSLNKRDFLIVLTNELLLFDGVKFLPFPPETPGQFKETQFYRNYRLRNGMTALGSLKKGLLILNSQGEVIHHFDQNNLLQTDRLHTIFQTRDQNIWVDHEEGIDLIHTSSPIRRMAKSWRNVTALCHSPIKTIVGGEPGTFVHAPNQKEWIPISGIDSSPQWIEFTSKDVALIGTNRFCYQVDFNKGLTSKIEGPETSPFKHKFAKGPLQFLIGTAYGLYVLHDSGTTNAPKWTVKNTIQGFQNEVHGLVSDSLGNLWTGTPGGSFFRFKINDQLTEISEINTLGAAQGLPIYQSNHLDSLRGEPVFITPDGLFQFNHEKQKFYEFNAINKIIPPGMQISGMMEESNRDLWMWGTVWDSAFGGPVPKICFLESLGEESKGNPIYRIRRDAFLKLSGPYSSPITTIIELQQNKVLISTQDKVFIWDRNLEFNPDRAFPAMVRKIEIIHPYDSLIFGGTFLDDNGFPSQSWSGNHRTPINYSHNALRFTYAALEFADPQKIKFQYFLEGQDEGWSPWTFERVKEYNNLREGSYTFRVRAINQYQTLSEESSYSFQILPPWYRTLWAYGLYFILGIVVIVVVVRIYTRRLKREKERLEQTVQDRTLEIASQAEELKQKNEQLLELDQFKQGLTSMIVHDLKNPLNSILNEEPYKGKDSMDKIKHAGSQMLNMVMNILDVSRFEETSIQLNLGKHRLDSIINSAWKKAEFLAREKQIDIQVSKTFDNIVLVDRSLIERVLVNLFTNAIKYSPAGSFVMVKVTTSSHEKTFVTVSDKGVGIPQTQIPKIFEKFGQVTARDSGKIRSTGLGLAFCKLAIEAHGEKIGVKSTLGEGSEFWFSLSRLKENDSANISEEEPDHPQQLNSPIHFTEEELATVKPIALQLNSLPIFEVSKIRGLLAIEELNHSPHTLRWKAEIEKALFAGNSLRYRELLSLVISPQ